VDGIVTDLHVRPGANVEPDAHLMEIVDLSEVYAEGRVFEGQIARVKTGQKVRVYVESFPKHVFTGTVDLVSGSLDPQTRTLKVMARVENLEWKLRPTMRARMHVVEAEAESAVTIPHSAVLGDAGHYFVFVQSDTDELVYEKKPVVLGLKDDRHFEVIEGVFPTDKVVVDGNYQLQYVTARRPAATPATSGDGTNAVAAAGGPGEHGASTGAGHSHGGMFGSPLFWMGAALTLMLLANVIVLLIKRRQPAVTDHLVEVEPPSSAAEKVRGSRIAHETAK
jgi:hypothetical protein